MYSKLKLYEVFSKRGARGNCFTRLTQYSPLMPYIGFIKQQSSSCTSPSLQYLTSTAKRGLLFIFMLSSTAALKTFVAFNVTICCLFTSLAMSVIFQAETGTFLILEIMVLLFGKSSNKTSVRLKKASFINIPSVNGFSCLAMQLCSYFRLFDSCYKLLS